MSATPPWWTDPWDLTADMDKIHQQWVIVRRLLENESLSGRRDPEISDWSCGEQAVHMLLIALTMADHIEGNLDEPDRGRGESLQDVASRVLTKGGFSRGVAKAPPEFRPDQTPPDQRSELLGSTIAAWERLSARADEIERCPARALHFVLGYLTSSEWVRMCAVHNAHHLRIVLDIVGEEALVAK